MIKLENSNLVITKGCVITTEEILPKRKLTILHELKSMERDDIHVFYRGSHDIKDYLKYLEEDFYFNLMCEIFEEFDFSPSIDYAKEQIKMGIEDVDRFGSGEIFTITFFLDLLINTKKDDYLFIFDLESIYHRLLYFSFIKQPYVFERKIVFVSSKINYKEVKDKNGMPPVINWDGFYDWHNKMVGD